MLPKREYLRPDEVATVLACSTRHIRRLCEAGQLYAFRIGDGPSAPLRIRRDSVTSYISRMRELYEIENGIICDEMDDNDA